MNTIEDRLREALRERAAHSPIDPDAWARIVVRSRRRPGRDSGWSRFMIPFGAAAAVVAIVAGAIVLTSHGSPPGVTGAAASSPPVSRAPAPGPSRPASGGITVFRELPGVGTGLFTLTAYLLKDGQVGFWSAGNAPSALSVSPASGPPAVGVFRDSPSGAVAVRFYGYAHENVTRVVLRLGDGKQYSAQTLAAWPGSGLRLWFFSVPTDLLRINSGQEVMLGYDSIGQVVWQQRAGG